MGALRTVESVVRLSAVFARVSSQPEVCEAIASVLLAAVFFCSGRAPQRDTRSLGCKARAWEAQGLPSTAQAAFFVIRNLVGALSARRDAGRRLARRKVSNMAFENKRYLVQQIFVCEQHQK